MVQKHKRKRFVTNKIYPLWLTFPYPYEIIREKPMDDQVTSWRTALERASEIYEKHQPSPAWFLAIPSAYRKDWMVEIGEEMGLVKPHTQLRPHNKVAAFHLGGPTLEWLRTIRRIERH